MLYYIIPAILLFLVLNYIGISIEKKMFHEKFKVIMTSLIILLFCTLGVNAYMLYSREQSMLIIDKNHSYVTSRIIEDMEALVLSIDDLMTDWEQHSHETKIQKLEEVQAVIFSMASYERVLFDYNWDRQKSFYRFNSQLIWHINSVLFNGNNNNIPQSMIDEMYAISHDTKALLDFISEANYKIEKENLSGRKRVDRWAEYVDELIFQFKYSGDSLYISKHVDFK